MLGVMSTSQPESAAGPGPDSRPTLRGCAALIRATTALLDAYAAPENPAAASPVEAAAFAVLVERLYRATARQQLTAARLADAAPVTDLGEAQLEGITTALSDVDAFANGDTMLPAGPCPRPGGKPVFANTGAFLARVLGIGPAAARRRLDAAAVLLPGRLSDETPATAAYPNLAGGLASGSTDPQTALAAAKRLDSLVPSITKHPDAAARLAAVEEEFAAAVATGSPHTAYKVIESIEAREEKDGGPPTPGELRARQGLFYRGLKHGLHEYKYHCDGLQHEVIQNLCDVADNPHLPEHGTRTPFTAPPATRTGNTSGSSDTDGIGIPAPDWAVDPGTPEEERPLSTLSDGAGWHDGTDPMQRTPAQRRLDAVIDALRLGPGGPEARRGISERTRLIVLIDYRSLLGQLEKAGATAHGTPVDPKRVRELAVGAGIIPVVLGGEGQVLDVGRSRRMPTAAQETAVLARDIGCVVPRCSMPIARSEIHHIHAWNEGGRTDIDNLAGACTAHHHDIHLGRLGIRAIAGVPYVIPPPDIDPARRPVRNLYWHPELAGNPYPPGSGSDPPRPERPG